MHGELRVIGHALFCRMRIVLADTHKNSVSLRATVQLSDACSSIGLHQLSLQHGHECITFVAGQLIGPVYWLHWQRYLIPVTSGSFGEQSANLRDSFCAGTTPD